MDDMRDKPSDGMQTTRIPEAERAMVQHGGLFTKEGRVKPSQYPTWEGLEYFADRNFILRLLLDPNGFHMRVPCETPTS